MPYRTAGKKHIVCAPGAFKGTLGAAEVARAMAAGVARLDAAISCDLCPIADGGDGTLEVLAAVMNGRIRRATVTGPRAAPIEAHWGEVERTRTGLVELALASGLALMPANDRDPTATTTFGTGELIRLAFQSGCHAIIVGIGGSATIDGGAGIAQALGTNFFDSTGRLIERPMTGGKLGAIARWKPPPRDSLPRIRVACDVTNPLCGPKGAAAVYGPQKGATATQVAMLDAALAHLAEIIGGDPSMPGAGAAGGAGFGLVNMLGAEIEPGAVLVLDAAGFDARCRAAALLMTGEGRLDSQSLHGKACMAAAARAAKIAVPAVAIVGSIGAGAEDCANPAKGGMLRNFVSLQDRFGLDRAMHDPGPLIAEVAMELARQVLT